MKQYLVDKPMTIRDAAIRLYGSWQHVFKLANENNLSIDESLDSGTILDYDETFGDLRVKNKISDENTDVINEAFLTVPAYGRLYNSFAYLDSKFAPVGWRTPTKADYDQLLVNIGTTDAAVLKEAGRNQYWTTDFGTNDFGFNARGCGYRQSNGNSSFLRQVNFQACNNSGSYRFNIYEGLSNLGFSSASSGWGLAVRLIKEDSTDVGNIYDLDGQRYPTVKIGEQVWLAADWASLYLNDGTPIPVVEDNTDWGNLITPGACAYDNDINNVFTKKRL